MTLQIKPRQYYIFTIHWCLPMHINVGLYFWHRHNFGKCFWILKWTIYFERKLLFVPIIYLYTNKALTMLTWSWQCLHVAILRNAIPTQKCQRHAAFINFCILYLLGFSYRCHHTAFINLSFVFIALQLPMPSRCLY